MFVLQSGLLPWRKKPLWKALENNRDFFLSWYKKRRLWHSAALKSGDGLMGPNFAVFPQGHRQLCNGSFRSQRPKLFQHPHFGIGNSALCCHVSSSFFGWVPIYFTTFCRFLSMKDQDFSMGLGFCHKQEKSSARNAMRWKNRNCILF